MRCGISYDIKIGYKRDTNSYLELMFNNFLSDATINNSVFVEPNGTPSSGTITFNQKITFIGIGGGVSDRGFFKKDTFLLDMYLGYLTLNDNATFQNKYTSTGSNLGISTNLSYYFGITEKLNLDNLYHLPVAF